MPVCRFHGVWPCLQCKLKTYKDCIDDNIKRKNENKPLDKDGKLMLHDLKDLRKDIIDMGGLVD